MKQTVGKAIANGRATERIRKKQQCSPPYLPIGSQVARAQQQVAEGPLTAHSARRRAITPRVIFVYPHLLRARLSTGTQGSLVGKSRMQSPQAKTRQKTKRMSRPNTRQLQRAGITPNCQLTEMIRKQNSSYPWMCSGDAVSSHESCHGSCGQQTHSATGRATGGSVWAEASDPRIPRSTTLGTCICRELMDSRISDLTWLISLVREILAPGSRRGWLAAPC